MSAHFTTPTDELLLLAETLGEVKTKADKLEAEFATQARPLEAATNALSAALSGIKALQFHVLDNNLGALSARVEEMRKAVDEQVGVIALELKKADETNAAKAGQEAEALRSEIAALQAQLGTLGAQFSAQLERVEFSAKEEAKKLQLIPGPAGAAGASLNPRGTFIDGETYNRLDVVSWLGSSYIAAVDGVTEKPSKNSNQWQVLASRGSGGSGGAGDFGSLAGVAQINQGGTGQTTRAAGLNALLPDQAGSTQYMLLTDGAGTVSWGAQPVAGLPSQTSNSGRLLTTNGTSASWSNAVTVSGSNATVTGTLTGNSTATIAGRVISNASSTATDSAGFAHVTGYSSGGKTYTGFAAGGIAVNQSAAFGYVYDSGTPANSFAHITPYGSTEGSLFKFSPAGVLTLGATTASTTTSSGALVVGNGTSGGLGVGGSINAGGNVTISGSNGYAVIGGRQWSFRANSSGGSPASGCVIRDDSAAADRLTIDINGNTSVLATTASTSTSSGALVVSGGVGVAGAINAGGTITSTNGSGSGLLGMRSSSGNASYVFWSETGVADRGILGFNNGSSTLSYRSFSSSFSTGTEVFSITSGGNVTAGGSVQTAAPSGGTAAAWKLGTVASVSPTSPNRTIEVDIGGTIYYIHAKTTNN